MSGLQQVAREEIERLDSNIEYLTKGIAQATSKIAVLGESIQRDEAERTECESDRAELVAVLDGTDHA